MKARGQTLLFPELQSETSAREDRSSTFVDNMSLPIHRWFRYSAGFSARWVEHTLRETGEARDLTVFDPFAGSATTLLAAESVGARSWGIDSHPFVSRIARAKLLWRSDVDAYLRKIQEIRQHADAHPAPEIQYPPLIYKCYDEMTLRELSALRRAYEAIRDDTAASELAWLTLVAILRRVSAAGTAQWQYVLPKKRKRSPQSVRRAFSDCSQMIAADMSFAQSTNSHSPVFVESDARTCEGIPNNVANYVITSPPYPNNYDYADAARLELSFLGEISGWGDLQSKIRTHLVRSCSQHVPQSAVQLEEVLSADELTPVRDELTAVCNQLSEIRVTKGGKKTYHLMIACYFYDLARVWLSLRRVCLDGATVCFVIGDSAPYGVYVPVISWLSSLAQAAGFGDARFEKTRDRNVKWKNRKHRVPLVEGRLWLKG
ncbi:MAG TPA: hypothetical protein VHD36_13775 [Pirellulales bacterium]|nr:hypothetical protein [Pirellulales bacterium]